MKDHRGPGIASAAADAKPGSMVFSRRLERLPLADRVYEVLQDGMLEGEYPPGTHLVQDTIAAQLDVSRTPVRDALIRLAHDGLIIAAGSRGYMVTEPPVADLAQILETRKLLEPHAALLALDFMSEADFRELEGINAHLLEGKPTSRESYDLNERFHMGLVSNCPNTMLVRILQDVWRMPRSRWIWKRAFGQGFDMAQSAREHQSILAAARRRDTDAYFAMLSDHIGAVETDMAGAEQD